MKTRQLRMRRALASVVTVLLLSVITARGLSLVPKPASSTGRKSLVPGSYQLRFKPAVARIAASASLAAQSNTGEIYSFLSNQCLRPGNESTAPRRVDRSGAVQPRRRPAMEEGSREREHFPLRERPQWIVSGCQGPRRQRHPRPAVDVQQDQQRELGTRRRGRRDHSTVDLASLRYQ